MTAIKQIAITSASHAKNLGRYLNDERALSRDSHNLADEDHWEEEMANTRMAFGHNKPCRQGAKNTIMYHQIIAFNPDNCDMNGGVMSPNRCMAFAREWIETRYPNQECIWVLHKEHCKSDETERYAVHIGINRTDLETGKRLNEGRARQAKEARAHAMREMDERWRLPQMVKGVRNSKVHARQPSKAEQKMRSRGIRTDKEYIKLAINATIAELATRTDNSSFNEFSQLLGQKGVNVNISQDKKNFVFARNKTGLKVSGCKLGRGYSKSGILRAIGYTAMKELIRTMDESLDRM